MSETTGNGTQQAPPQRTPQMDLRDLLEKYKKQIAMALPKHLTPERMMRMAMTTFMRNPQLHECYLPSILSCVIQASELGLELSGPLGQAYMVPRKNKHHINQATGEPWMEANFQVGYRGLIDLAYRSNRVKMFAPYLAYAGDKFSYRLGTDPVINHIPGPGPYRDEDITHIYAVLKMKNGGVDFEVMTKGQVDAHRARYSKQRGGEFDPWGTAYGEMAKKTPLRRLAKRAPLSVELVTAAVLDEYAEMGIAQDLPLVEQPLAIEDRTRTSQVEQMLAERLARGREREPEPVEVGGIGEEQAMQMRAADAAQGHSASKEALADLTGEISRLKLTQGWVDNMLRDNGVKVLQKLTQEQAETILGRLRDEPTPQTVPVEQPKKRAAAPNV
jgi:recombination protein RecT